MKWLNRQEGMADAVNANVTILVVLRANRALICIRELWLGYLIACRRKQVFHGMGTFVDATGRNHQQGHDEN